MFQVFALKTNLNINNMLIYQPICCQYISTNLNLPCIADIPPCSHTESFPKSWTIWGRWTVSLVFRTEFPEHMDCDHPQYIKGCINTYDYNIYYIILHSHQPSFSPLNQQKTSTEVSRSHRSSIASAILLSSRHHGEKTQAAPCGTGQAPVNHRYVDAQWTLSVRVYDGWFMGLSGSNSWVHNKHHWGQVTLHWSSSFCLDDFGWFTSGL